MRAGHKAVGVQGQLKTRFFGSTPPQSTKVQTSLFAICSVEVPHQPPSRAITLSIFAEQ